MSALDITLGVFITLVVLAGVVGMVKVIFFDDDTRPSDRDY